MKRFQRFPDEASRIGHILFWLFPYEQDALAPRSTRDPRAMAASERTEHLGREPKITNRPRSTKKTRQRCISVMTSFLLLGGFAGSSHAQYTDRVGLDAGAIEGRAVNLAQGESIKLSCLVGPAGSSPQVGDKTPGNSTSKPETTDSGVQNNLGPTAVSLPALGNTINPDVSLAGAQPVTGVTTEDPTIVPSIVPTDSHQRGNDPVREKGFSSAVEMAFTGKSGGGNVGSLDALTSRDASPAFQNISYSSSEAQPITKPTPVFSSVSAWESQFPVPLQTRH
jgi:hypothetical protein